MAKEETIGALDEGNMESEIVRQAWCHRKPFSSRAHIRTEKSIEQLECFGIAHTTTASYLSVALISALLKKDRGLSSCVPVVFGRR